jgi:uncharacterized protein
MIAVHNYKINIFDIIITMKTFVFRLKPNSDLKKELFDFSQKEDIKAGIILTCVGSLKKATLRMAGRCNPVTFDKKFEINSLVGTISQNGVHLHTSLSDKKGKSIGGHLKEGCIIYTTAEIVIGKLDNFEFDRVFDEETGFKELKIKKTKKT